MLFVYPSNSVFSKLKNLKSSLLGNVIIANPNGSEILIPPLPITKKIYKCDSKYHLDFLLTLYEEHPQIGLAYVLGDEVCCYIKQGSKINCINKLSIFRQRSHNKGGQSAQRFDRTHQNLIAKFINDAINLITQSFFDFDIGQLKIVSLTIASAGTLSMNIFQELIPNLKTITKTMIIDTSHINAKHILSNLEFDSSNQDRKQEDEIKTLIETNLNLVVYGTEMLDEELKQQTIKKVFILENLQMETYGLKPIIMKRSTLLANYGGAIGIRFFVDITRL